MVMKAASKISVEDKLLNTARRLFCSEGINATGISRIIEEADVARKSLYNHYGSKENLLKAVIESEASMWFQWFDVDIANRATEPFEQILAVFDLLKEWFAGDDFFGCIFINAVAEHNKIESWVRDVAMAHREKINTRLQGLAFKAGVGDPSIAAEKIGLVIDGAIVNAMITRQPQLADIAQSIAKDILLRGRAAA
jgi:AcrR family transcriptional regulator